MTLWNGTNIPPIFFAKFHALAFVPSSLCYSHSRSFNFALRHRLEQPNGSEIVHRGPLGLSLPHPEPPVRCVQARTGFGCSTGRGDRGLRAGPVGDRLSGALRRSDPEELRLLLSGSC